MLGGVAEHMRGLGLGALRHAIWHANYYSPYNEWWNELSVLQAAHAAEILIKARIAEVHPLLIFDQLPKVPIGPDQQLTFEHLSENGKTIQFAELPDRLWAAAGERLPNIELYRKFGRLRNSIQHFAVPAGVEAGGEALRFIFEIVDPLINKCWGLYAIDFNEDDEPYQYLVEGLARRGIRFLVSPEAADEFVQMGIAWPDNLPKYKQEMLRRFKVAMNRSRRGKSSSAKD